MDGAMKFVKGDAIAGLFILVVDIVGGVTVGVFEHDMSITEALRSYGMLTIGDGLVTQIPALLIAMSAALLVTRVASSGRADAQHLGHDIVDQLGDHPRALAAASVFMAGLALMPGLPMVPFLALALAGAGATIASFKRVPVDILPPQDVGSLPPRLVIEGPVDAIEGQETALTTAVTALGARWGMPLPNPVVIQNSTKHIRILMDGFPAATLTDESEGVALPARVCQELEPLLPDMLSIQDVQHLLERWREREPELVRSVVPQHLSLFELTTLLRSLLRDGVGISPLRTVLEAALQTPADANARMLLSTARRALGRRIAERLLAEERPILLVGAGITHMLRDGLRKNAGEEDELRLKSDIQEEIVRAIEATADDVGAPSVNECALVIDERARWALETVTRARYAGARVVSIEELAAGERAGILLEIAGTVDVGTL